MKEATVVMARCGNSASKAAFGITMEKEAKEWVCVWAFPLREASAKREGFDSKSASGSIVIGNDYPGCPACGAGGFVQCQCGKISCFGHGQKSAVCPFCGRKMDSFTEGDFDNVKTGAY